MRRPWVARSVLAALAAAIVVAPGAAQAASYQTGWFSWVIAGSPLYPCAAAPDCQDGADALSGRLGSPSALAIGAGGSVLIADYDNAVVRRVTPAGALSTMTTTGSFAVDGGGAHQPFPGTSGIAVGPDGAIFVATDGDAATDATEDRVYRVANGAVTVYAGVGTEGFAGDDGPATAAQLNDPAGLDVDAAGNLYIADSGSNRVRRVDAATGIITTVAGNGATCAADPLNLACVNDGAAPLAAALSGPLGLAVTPDGSTLYIADSAANRIRRVSGGAITTFAGSGNDACSCTDDQNGPANGPNVAVEGPTDVDLAADGTAFITEQDASLTVGRVRRVGTDGVITTIAGGGPPFPLLAPAAGQALPAGLVGPSGVEVDEDGNLLVTEEFWQAVLWLVPSTPLGIPGPKGDKGDKGDTGSGGASGPKGPKGDRGGQTPLATWVCKKRKHGIGRYAVSCFARVFAADGSRVRARLVRAGDVFARDSSREEDGEARLHLRSKERLRGVYALRLTERTRKGAVRTDTIRVAI